MTLSGMSTRLHGAGSWQRGVFALAVLALLFLSARPVCEAFGAVLPHAPQSTLAHADSAGDQPQGDDDGWCCDTFTAAATAIAADLSAFAPAGGKAAAILAVALLLFAPALPRAARILVRSDPPERRYQQRSARLLR